MKKITLNKTSLLLFHQAILNKFKQNHPNAELPSYQIYGFNEDESLPSIKQDIIEQYKAEGRFERLQELFKIKKGKLKFNAKYLRDAVYVRAEKSEDQEISFNEKYLEVYLNYIGYNKLDDFFKSLPQEDLVVAKRRAISKNPTAKKILFKCHYYHLATQQLEEMDLIVQGDKVSIIESPSGKSYSGYITDFELTSKNGYEKKIMMESMDLRGQVSDFILYLRGKLPTEENGCSLTPCFYRCMSPEESSAGAMLIESPVFMEEMNKIDWSNYINPNISPYHFRKDLLEEIVSKYQLSTLVKEDLSAIWNNNLYNLFICVSQDESLDNEQCKQKYINIIKQTRENHFFRRFLHPQSSTVTPHHAIRSGKTLQSTLNEVAPNWEANQTLLDKLQGYYVGWVAMMMFDPRTNEETRTIEQLCITIRPTGTVKCYAAGQNTFDGTVVVQNQQNVLIRLEKSGQYAHYHIVLDISNDVVPSPHTSSNNKFFLSGGFCGITRQSQPQADKVLFVRIEEENFYQPQSRPGYIRVLNVLEYLASKENKNLDEKENDKSLDEEDIARIKFIAEHYSNIKEFFSLRARDRYHRNSGIVFNNFNYFPETDLQDFQKFAGEYVYFRFSRTNYHIKLFPMVISPDGQVKIKGIQNECHGKALVLGSKIAIMIYSQEKFHCALFIPFSKYLHKPQNEFMGVVMKTQGEYNRIAYRVPIFKIESKQYETLEFQKISIGSDQERFNKLLDVKTINGEKIKYLSEKIKNNLDIPLGYYLLLEEMYLGKANDGKHFSSISEIAQDGKKQKLEELIDKMIMCTLRSANINRKGKKYDLDYLIMRYTELGGKSDSIENYISEDSKEIITKLTQKVNIYQNNASDKTTSPT